MRFTVLFALVPSALLAACSGCTVNAPAVAPLACTSDENPQPDVLNCDSAQAACSTDTDCFVRFGDDERTAARVDRAKRAYRVSRRIYR
jgi:hypothetical protein